MRTQTLLLNSFLKVDQFTITNLLWFEVLIYKVDQRNQITWGTLCLSEWLLSTFPTI
jgi:hypothetical protein